MKKRIICLTLVISLSLILAGCCLSHEWADATCTAPKTCSKCEKTEGDALGHNWNEATCTEAKKCSVCGDTDGVALGHTWIAATCTSAKTCSVCNKKEGDTLPHNCDWSITVEPSYTSEGQQEGICKECGEIVTETIDAIVPEYHWNEPIKISDEFTIGMYTDNNNYWIELSAKTLDSATIVTALRYGLYDLGFDVDGFMNWYQHIIDYSTGAWVSNGTTFASMEGYGRKWVIYMNTSDGSPGLLGMKVNSEKEFEAVVGIDITN